MPTSFEHASIAASRRYRLHSERIGETFQIDVALPAAAPEGALPVVYVMDSNTVFGIAAQAMRFLQSGDRARPALLVGVGYCLDGVERPRNAYGALRTRDLTPSLDQGFLDLMAEAQNGQPFQATPRATGGADDFLNFLVDELRPFVAERYDIDHADQALVGSSLGGLFSLYAMLTRPGAFASYVANSAALWWDARMLFKLEEAFAQRRTDLCADLFLSVGGLEVQAPWSMVENFERFTNQLRQRAYPNLKLTTHLFENESHTSVIPAALSRGLRAVLGGDARATHRRLT